MAEKPALKILDWFSDVVAGLSLGKERLTYVTADGTMASKTMSEVQAPKQNGPAERDVVQKATLDEGPWQDVYWKNFLPMCVWVGKCSRLIVRWWGRERCAVMSFGL